MHAHSKLLSKCKVEEEVIRLIVDLHHGQVVLSGLGVERPLDLKFPREHDKGV